MYLFIPQPNRVPLWHDNTLVRWLPLTVAQHHPVNCAWNPGACSHLLQEKNSRGVVSRSPWAMSGRVFQPPYLLALAGWAAWPWWVIQPWGILQQHSQTFTFTVLSHDISDTIATPSVAYTTNFWSGTQLKSEWVCGEWEWTTSLHAGNAWRRESSAGRGMLPSTWGTSPAASPGGIRAALLHQDTFQLWEF